MTTSPELIPCPAFQSEHRHGSPTLTARALQGRHLHHRGARPEGHVHHPQPPRVQHQQGAMGRGREGVEAGAVARTRAQGR